MLKQATLNDREIACVRAILLNVVATRFRQEFRECCRLAVKVADPVFIETLKERAASTDLGTHLRAGWMLGYLTQSGSSM